MPGIVSCRLKATILEPMIALMIILFSLTASFLIVIKAAHQTNIQQQVRATAEVDKIIGESLEEASFLDEKIDIDGIRIVKEVARYNNNENLLVLMVSAFDNRNRLLITRRNIIEIDESESK